MTPATHRGTSQTSKTSESQFLCKIFFHFCKIEFTIVNIVNKCFWQIQLNIKLPRLQSFPFSSKSSLNNEYDLNRQSILYKNKFGKIQRMQKHVWFKSPSFFQNFFYFFKIYIDQGSVRTNVLATVGNSKRMQ